MAATSPRKRIDRDTLFMTVAALAAERGTCPRKQVGAVIVVENRIVSMGYNGAPPGLAHCTEVGCNVDETTFQGCQRAIHAEVNALAFSARQGQATDGAVMYSTCATCVPCAQLLLSAGIREFVFREPYRLRDGIELLKQQIKVRQWTH